MTCKFIRQILIGLIALSIVIPTKCAHASNVDAAAKAKADYSADDFKKATKDCSEWLDKHPDDAEIIRLRGKCFLALGEFPKAIKDLESTPSLPGPLELAMANQDYVNQNDDDNFNYPSWLEALVLLYSARLNAQEGQLDRAIKLCDSALAINPTFPECLALRGTICAKQFRLFEAEEYFRQAISLRPLDWHLWTGYSAVLEQQQKIQLALEAIDKALELVKHPPYPEPSMDARIDVMNKQRDYLVKRKDH